MDSLNERLKEYRAAEQAILVSGQSYRIDSRQFSDNAHKGIA